MSGLKKPLTFISGTSMILNIVIGAGLLALPGLAFKQAGEFALLSWIVCAVVSIPLLTIFILLGRRFPNAGGVAHFTQKAFGDNGYVVASLLFLGAVIFGLPSITLTGGYYASGFIGFSPHLIALVILIASALMHLLSSAFVAQVNIVMSALILMTIFTIIFLGYFSIDNAASSSPVNLLPDLRQIPFVFTPFMMIFFAFTGWEIASGLSEEFKNPKRDFVLAMMVSFLLAVILYMSIAFIVQRSEISSSFETAFAQIANNAIGSQGQLIISLIAVLIVFANLSGAIWGVSRLIFSLSRESFLPKAIQNTAKGTPYISLAITTAALASVIVLDWTGFLGLETMLSLAGQNFLVLYGLAAAAYYCVSKNMAERLLAVLSVIIVFSLVVAQGLFATYPVLLIVSGVIIVQFRKKISNKDIRLSKVESAMRSP